jgi:hypothetical protein
MQPESAGVSRLGPQGRQVLDRLIVQFILAQQSAINRTNV